MSDSSSRPEHQNTMLPFVSVVMPAHNEEQYIAQCLQSLQNQDYPADRFEIIVVDNNSTDRTPEIAKSFGASVLFQGTGPVGAVRNLGAGHAKGEIITFIDSDCVAPKNWIRNCVTLITSQPETAFGGGCYLRENPHPIERLWLLSNNNEGTLPKHLIGATIAITKKDFVRAGMFDTSITSGEDTKLTESLKKAGINVQFCKSLNVAHLGNPITTKAFFKRQIWHSENYLKDLNASLRDPIFYLVNIFALLLVAAIAASPFNTLLSLSFLILALSLPFALSIKRIKRAQYKLKSVPEIFYIYWLDLLYVLGRCTGLAKSAISKWR